MEYLYLYTPEQPSEGYPEAKRQLYLPKDLYKLKSKIGNSLALPSGHRNVERTSRGRPFWTRGRLGYTMVPHFSVIRVLREIFQGAELRSVS